MMTKPVVLVTGAGGFIGGWVAEALHLAGWDVRAGISRWMSAARIARFPLEIVQCNVMDQASLDDALKGVDVVVHCARGPDEDDEVAKSGTRLLIERAKLAGATKMVFTSSVAVYGDATGLIGEDTAPVGDMSAYGNSKLVAEAVCDELATDDFPIVGIRPTLVYGPFSQQWSAPYVARFASGRWTALGARGEGKCNLVYVGDLVRMIRFMIENDTGRPRSSTATARSAELELLSRALQRRSRLSAACRPDPSLAQGRHAGPSARSANTCSPITGTCWSP